NLASQVGALYATGDNRRADAFQIYYIFINAGVIAAPLIAGTLGEVYGWHYGFGAAGVGMLIGLTIYLSGRRWLPPDSPIVRKSERAAKIPLTHREKMAIVALLALLPVLTIAVIGNQQIFNAYLVWAQDNVDLVFFSRKMPTTWLITLDSIVSVSFLAGAVVFWRLWSRKFPEPVEITKMGIGSLIAVTGFISLAIGGAIAASSGGKVSIGWLITFHVLNSIGFANVFPVSLALYARVAPAALSATIIGIFYLHLFAANNLVGWIGGFLEKIPATQFWLLHAGLCGVAGVIFLVAGRLCGLRLLFKRLPVGHYKVLEVPLQQRLHRPRKGLPVTDGHAKENTDPEQAWQPHNMPDKKTLPATRFHGKGKEQVRHDQGSRGT